MLCDSRWRQIHRKALQVRFDFGVVMENEQDGSFITMTPYGLTTHAPVRAAHCQPIPESVALHPIFTNSFNPSTRITYDLPVRSSVRFTIYDLTGRQVDELAAVEEAGGHQLTWPPTWRRTGFCRSRRLRACSSAPEMWPSLRPMCAASTTCRFHRKNCKKSKKYWRSSRPCRQTGGRKITLHCRSAGAAAYEKALRHGPGGKGGGKPFSNILHIF